MQLNIIKNTITDTIKFRLSEQNDISSEQTV